LFTCPCIKRTGNIEEQNVDVSHVLSVTRSIENGYTALPCPKTGNHLLLSRLREGRFMLRKAGQVSLALPLIAESRGGYAV
jgi:hypothetical protein